MENVRDCEDGRTGRLTARAYLIMGPGGEGEGIRQDDAKGLSECDEVGTGAAKPPPKMTTETRQRATSGQRRHLGTRAR